MPQIIEIPGMGQVSFPDGMTDADISTAIQRNTPKPAGLDFSDPLSPASMARAEAGRAVPDAPSMGGSFIREAGRSIGPGLAGMWAGGASGAAIGAAGLNPLTVALGAVGGGVAGFLGARKLQDVAADSIAPNSFMGTLSAEQDMATNKWSTMLGGALGGGGAPGPLRGAMAIPRLMTAEGRQVLGTGLQQGASVAARQASNDILEPIVGAGVGVGLGAAHGADGAGMAEQAGLGLLFNRGWHNTLRGQPKPISTDTQYGVQGDPATGLPEVVAGSAPLETNATVVPTGPLKAAGATRLAGDLAARAGIDPLALVPSGDNATVTPNDVRAAGSRLRAITQDSGGTIVIDQPRAPEASITDLIGKPVKWDGIDGTLINDGGRPHLQTEDGALIELPFSYHTDSSITELGVTPTGDRVVDRQAATRLFGDDEGGAMHQIFSRISTATDDILDIAELGASTRSQKGQKGVSVRDTPEFAQHAKGVTDEALLVAKEETQAALADAESNQTLSNDTRDSITAKLRGDIENIDALVAARDTWQRQRLPLPTSGLEAPSQRASLAAADATRNRAAAVSELNGQTPRRPAVEPAPLGPSRQLGDRTFSSTDLASRLRARVEPPVATPAADLPQTAANIIALAKELDPVAFKAAVEEAKAFAKRRKDEGIPLGDVLAGDQITLAAQTVLTKHTHDPRALRMLDGYGEDQFSRLRPMDKPPVAKEPTPITPEPTPPTATTPLKGSVALATGRLNAAKNQLAKLEASGKASPEQIKKRLASLTTLERQIAEATPDPDSRARQLQKRVDEVHDSGEFETITRIRQNGGFAPQDRMAGLIDRNNQRGAKLNEQNRKVAAGFGETRDDAMRTSDFPETPGGQLAAGTLRSLHNKSPNAQTVDQIADAMGLTVKDFHAKLNAELESIHQNNGPKANAQEEVYSRQERQLVDFEKVVEEAPANSKATPDQLGLEKGDTLTIDGEPLKVIAATDESVTLRDHDKFGDQKVSNDTAIPAENVESQAKSRLADEAPDAIAADEAATRRQVEEYEGEKPAPADDFALKPHSSDAEIKAEKAAVKQKEELAKRQAAPLKGSAGDLTPDIFGEGDTPLFNSRRDTPKQKAPASRDDVWQQARDKARKDFENDPLVTPAPPKEYDTLTAISDMASRRGYDPEHLTPDRISAAKEQGLISGNKNFKLTESGRSKLYEWQRAARDRSMDLGSRTDKAVDDALSKFDQGGDKKQKSIIDGLKAHQDEVKGWIKGEQKSGRMNSMPIDILGAQAYDAALTVTIKALEAGASIGKAVKAAIDHIKKTRQLSRDEEATIKAALIAKSQDSLRFAGERDAKLMLEMPKIAEELVAQGKTPTQQYLINTLAARFPDQAPYIRANGDKIFKDMMFARDTRLSRTTDSQREWGEWADSAIDGTRRMVDSFTKGAPMTNVKQFATNFHATYMTGIGNKMRHLAEGNITGNKSNAWGKWTEDLVGLAKGKDGVHRVSTDLAMNTDVTTFANHLDQIKTNLNPMLNAMPRGERKAFMERVGDHITDSSRDGELINQPELRRAVEAYVKIREDLLKHMRDSGVEVGDVGPRSMRRVLDRPTILGNKEEFVKQAANAYKAKWRTETAALNKEAAGLDPIKNKDRLVSIKTELQEIAKLDAADSARKYLINIEADEVGITSDGNDLFSHNNGNPSSMKSREFGPEADQLLGKFYLRDPDAILRREIGDSVRAAGVARTFSGPALDPQGNPRPNGEIDPMAKWKKLRQDLIDEGNPDMIPMAATLLKEHFNLGGQDSPAMRTALEIAHTHTQLAFLARSAFSSLGEPALAGIRSGKLSDIAAGYVKTFKGMARELRGLGPDEARIISNAIGTSNDGFNSILAANRFLDSYAVAGKSGELVAMFHAKTWLTALTNATHAASVDISHGFIRTQLELRQAGGKYKTTAGKSLNEIGITTADIPAMLKFTDDFAKSTDKVKLLTADTPEAKMYRDALHLVRMSGGSLHVLRGTRPQHANSPVGGMFYALKSFLFAFQDQVLSRHARLVQTAVKGETMVDGAMEKLSAAERRKMIGETAQAVATLAAAQYGIQVLRESLFSDPARMKEERKTPAEKARMRAYSVATRSSFFGGYDIIFNAMTGARHGGDPSTAALGPSGGLAGSIFGQIAGIGGKKDSPNTNTHERKLARSVWDFTAKPLANAAAATLPGYKIATPLVQAFNHPGTREALVKTVAGAPMKGGPMKKKSTGF